MVDASESRRPVTLMGVPTACKGQLVFFKVKKLRQQFNDRGLKFTWKWSMEYECKVCNDNGKLFMKLRS